MVTNIPIFHFPNILTFQHSILFQYSNIPCWVGGSAPHINIYIYIYIYINVACVDQQMFSVSMQTTETYAHRQSIEITALGFRNLSPLYEQCLNKRIQGKRLLKIILDQHAPPMATPPMYPLTLAGLFPSLKSTFPRKNNIPKKK